MRWVAATTHRYVPCNGSADSFSRLLLACGRNTAPVCGIASWMCVYTNTHVCSHWCALVHVADRWLRPCGETRTYCDPLQWMVSALPAHDQRTSAGAAQCALFLRMSNVPLQGQHSAHCSCACPRTACACICHVVVTVDVACACVALPLRPSFFFFLHRCTSRA